MIGYRVLFIGKAEDPEARPSAPPEAGRWMPSKKAASDEAEQFHECAYGFQLEEHEVEPYDARWSNKLTHVECEQRFYVPFNANGHQEVQSYLTMLLGNGNFKIRAVNFVRLSRFPPNYS